MDDEGNIKYGFDINNATWRAMFSLGNYFLDKTEIDSLNMERRALLAKMWDHIKITTIK